VTRLDDGGTGVSFSRILGGNGFDDCEDLRRVDSTGDLYVTGGTRSTNFPTMNPICATNAGGEDVFLTRLNSDGFMQSSTYFGGSEDDSGRALDVNGLANVYVAGVTESGNVPTAGFGANTYEGGGSDGLFARFDQDVSACC
jgi:hypothetical protein